MQKEVVVPREAASVARHASVAGHLSNRPQLGTMRQRLALCWLAAACGALQPAARKPTPRTRRRSSEQTDPVLEVERLENAIAASTEPDEQKQLAEKLGMSRMSAEMSVLSANAAFYDAFQSCDVAKMKAVWSDSDDVTCVHPGHPLLSGADRVLNSWRALFASAGGMPKLEAQRQRVVLRGSAAWVTCNEAPEGEPSALEAINVFERRDGRWCVSASEASPRPRRDVRTHRYMVHHQAGPVFVQQPPQ